MSNSRQQFGCLAAKFEVVADNLKACETPEQRRESLIEMMTVLGWIDSYFTNDHLPLDSAPESTVPSNPPLTKNAQR